MYVRRSGKSLLSQHLLCQDVPPLPSGYLVDLVVHCHVEEEEDYHPLKEVCVEGGLCVNVCTYICTYVRTYMHTYVHVRMLFLCIDRILVVMCRLVTLVYVCTWIKWTYVPTYESSILASPFQQSRPPCLVSGLDHF